ncbi:MAG TPA: hypothetical protein VJI15_02715 [Candidatus Nanoarchaeia archaeon]|nr:hypothetical protein [Candidatus Nanoarchaeia archaeon]
MGSIRLVYNAKKNGAIIVGERGTPLHQIEKGLRSELQRFLSTLNNITFSDPFFETAKTVQKECLTIFHQGTNIGKIRFYALDKAEYDSYRYPDGTINRNEGPQGTTKVVIHKVIVFFDINSRWGKSSGENSTRLRDRFVKEFQARLPLNIF